MVEKDKETIERGLIKYDPKGCSEGYTLFSNSGGTTVYLIDTEGQVVHTWPTARGGTDLAELLPNGHIIYGQEQRGIGEADWDGNQVWFYICTWHHDFSLLPNGRIMMLCGIGEKVFEQPEIFEGCKKNLAFTPDYFLEIDRKTLARTWEWWAHEHVNELRTLVKFPRPIDERSKYRMGDIFHCNTLEVLPDTELGRQDKRFQANNILFSYRQIDVIGVVEHDTGFIVWTWGPGELDGQHMPTLIPDTHPITGEPMPGAGHILVFDNGRYWRNYSRILEIDPLQNKVVWSSPSNWHSWHISGAERLPNGNTFICDGPVGRLFEITPEGETVWEYWVPFTRKGPIEELGSKAVHGDTGGKDTSYVVYRAVRYPWEYVQKILKQCQGKISQRRVKDNCIL